MDTETALGLLKDRGYTFVQDPEKADILIVNTCGFIESAKEESIDTILDMARYKQSGRCRLLVVTGCLTQRYGPDLMKEMPEIDILLGVNQYAALPDAIAADVIEFLDGLDGYARNVRRKERPRILEAASFLKGVYGL